MFSVNDNGQIELLEAGKNKAKFLRILLQKFFDTWAETTAAYAAYRELRVKAPGDLAHQGLRRCEVARRAMGLPRLPRV